MPTAELAIGLPAPIRMRKIEEVKGRGGEERKG
jgi:hypothetical protein